MVVALGGRARKVEGSGKLFDGFTVEEHDCGMIVVGWLGYSTGSCNVADAFTAMLPLMRGVIVQLLVSEPLQFVRKGFVHEVLYR